MQKRASVKGDVHTDAELQSWRLRDRLGRHVVSRRCGVYRLRRRIRRCRQERHRRTWLNKHGPWRDVLRCNVNWSADFMLAPATSARWIGECNRGECAHCNQQRQAGSNAVVHPCRPFSLIGSHHWDRKIDINSGRLMTVVVNPSWRWATAATSWRHGRRMTATSQATLSRLASSSIAAPSPQCQNSARQDGQRHRSSFACERTRRNRRRRTRGKATTRSRRWS